MKYFLFIPILFLSVVGIAQQNSNHLIEWNESRKLRWSDFQGRPMKGSSAYAATQSIVSIGFKQLSRNEVFVEVHSYVDKKKSWAKKDRSNELLAHEQLHADISELFARKIRKALKTRSFRTIDDLNDFIKVEYKKLMKEENDYQRLYDKESRHSINKEEQKRWEQKVAQELKALKNYSEAEIEIVLKK